MDSEEIDQFIKEIEKEKEEEAEKKKQKKWVSRNLVNLFV